MGEWFLVGVVDGLPERAVADCAKYAPARLETPSSINRRSSTDQDSSSTWSQGWVHIGERLRVGADGVEHSSNVLFASLFDSVEQAVDQGDRRGVFGNVSKLVSKTSTVVVREWIIEFRKCGGVGGEPISPPDRRLVLLVR